MEKYNELIDAYLRDELQGEEKIKFEERLSKDEDLKREFNEVYELKQALRYNDLSNKLDFVKDLELSISREDQKKNNRLGAILGGIVIILLILFVWWKFKPVQSHHLSNENKYAHHFEDEAFDNLIEHNSVRSVQKPIKYTDEQLKAYNLYAIQSFENAIPLLEELWVNQRDTLAYFYLGVSYLGLNQEEKAKEILNNPTVGAFKNNPIKQKQ